MYAIQHLVTSSLRVAASGLISEWYTYALKMVDPCDLAVVWYCNQQPSQKEHVNLYLPWSNQNNSLHGKASR